MALTSLSDPESSSSFPAIWQASGVEPFIYCAPDQTNLLSLPQYYPFPLRFIGSGDAGPSLPFLLPFSLSFVVQKLFSQHSILLKEELLYK